MILLSVHLSENIPSDRSYFIYNNFIYVFILSTLLKFFMQYLDKYRTWKRSPDAVFLISFFQKKVIFTPDFRPLSL